MNYNRETLMDKYPNLQDFIIFRNVEEDYGLLQELGRGTYGNVFSAYKRSETSDYIYAIKIFKSTNNEGFFEELNVMVQAGKHDNILDFLQLYIGNKIGLVLDFCPFTFEKLIKSQDKEIDEIEGKALFRQIVSAFLQLTEKSIVHRDLKPENILLNSQNIIKIADFGTAKFIDPNNIEVSQQGTPLYMDPLMFKSYQFQAPEKLDVWSFGMILYQAFVGKIAIEATNLYELMDFHKSRDHITIPTNHTRTHKLLSPQLQDLLKNILVYDEKKRFSWKQIANHPWFAAWKIQGTLLVSNVWNNNNQNDDGTLIFNMSVTTKQESTMVSFQQGMKNLTSKLPPNLNKADFYYKMLDEVRDMFKLVTQMFQALGRVGVIKKEFEGQLSQFGLNSEFNLVLGSNLLELLCAILTNIEDVQSLIIDISKDYPSKFLQHKKPEERKNYVISAFENQDFVVELQENFQMFYEDYQKNIEFNQTQTTLPKSASFIDQKKKVQNKPALFSLKLSAQRVQVSRLLSKSKQVLTIAMLQENDKLLQNLYLLRLSSLDIFQLSYREYQTDAARLFMHNNDLIKELFFND